MGAKGKLWADLLHISSFFEDSSFQFFDSSWQKKVTVAYWLCFCNGKPLVYRVLYEAPLRTQSPLTNSLPISNLISKIRYLLQKYRHTRNLLETRVIIKMLAHPCYPTNVDWFSWEWSKKINFCKIVFKMADSKKLRFSKPPILKSFLWQFQRLAGPWVSRIDWCEGH